MEFQVAVLSDIHGNRWALEAVLEDIDRRGVKTVVNLGDCVYGPLDPDGTADILMKYNFLTVRGNEDRIIYESDSASLVSATLHYVRENLRPDQIKWLQSLRITEILFDYLLLFHGTPDHDKTYLVYDVQFSRLQYRSVDELQNILGSRKENFFLCGHDHQPNVFSVPDIGLIVNPGSVGLPAYDDDLPYFHKVENGSPLSSYCILEGEGKNLKVNRISVSYDYQTAADTAEKNNHPDWSYWLKTGRVK